MKHFLLLDILKGFWTTLRYMFKRKYTIPFPHAITPTSPRFRGQHALRIYDNGEEKRKNQ